MFELTGLLKSKHFNRNPEEKTSTDSSSVQSGMGCQDYPVDAQQWRLVYYSHNEMDPSSGKWHSSKDQSSRLSPRRAPSDNVNI